MVRVSLYGAVPPVTRIMYLCRAWFGEKENLLLNVNNTKQINNK
jgi:hypothetical protein